MPKNDNTKAIHLYDSVKITIGEEAADKMAETVYLSKSADFKRKFKWAGDVCAYLERNFEEEQVKRIRMGCSCAPSLQLIKKLRSMYKRCGSLDAFAREYEALGGGSYTLNYEDGALVLTYPQCYCDCVRRVDEPVSKTWCLCTLGHTKKIFDEVLERETEVELLKSIKTGGSCCVIKISNVEASED